MRRRIYWLLPDMASAMRALDNLLLARIGERHIRFVGHDGVDLADLPKANAPQTSDVIRAAQAGAALGAGTGALAGTLAAMHILVAGDPPQWVLIGLLAAVGALLGAWTAAVIGLAVPSQRLRCFQPAIADGLILLMVDAPRARLDAEGSARPRAPPRSCGAECSVCSPPPYSVPLPYGAIKWASAPVFYGVAVLVIVGACWECYRMMRHCAASPLVLPGLAATAATVWAHSGLDPGLGGPAVPPMALMLVAVPAAMALRPSPERIVRTVMETVFPVLFIASTMGYVVALRALPDPDGEDLVMLLFGEFNVFRPADARFILEKSIAALKPDGLLLLEPSPAAHIRRLGQAAPGWYSSPGGLFDPGPHLVLSESFWDKAHQAATTRVPGEPKGTVWRWAAPL